MNNRDLEINLSKSKARAKGSTSLSDISYCRKTAKSRHGPPFYMISPPKICRIQGRWSDRCYEVCVSTKDAGNVSGMKFLFLSEEIVSSRIFALEAKRSDVPCAKTSKIGK